jgi:hypothetical protein
VDFELQQEQTIDDDDDCGCDGWQWNWGWNWGGCWDHDWDCGHGWSCGNEWSWGGCIVYQYLNFGFFRWSGMFNDGMICGCHIWTGCGPSGEERRDKEGTEVSETDEE